MLTLEDPWLKSALASDCPPEVLCDYLDDQQVALGDVLRLYAGTPPEFVDGIPQECLALWVAQHELGMNENAKDDLVQTIRGMGVIPLRPCNWLIRLAGLDTLRFGGFCKEKQRLSAIAR